MFTIKDLTTAETFIKDAVIDKVLEDLNLKLLDLQGLDQHGWDLFEYLCQCKQSQIMGAAL